MLLLPVVLLGYLGYEYLISNLIADASYRHQIATLHTSWQGATGQSVGAPVGVLRIPALGLGYSVPILSGTRTGVLRRGVGHYPGTAMPGQLGNCALAGLRVTNGQPFAGLHKLRRGDEIVVETRQATFTYVLDVPPRELTVQSTASWVLDPVPGQPRAQPTRALLTLTTSQDIWPTSDRSVGFAHLASTQNKG